jgi:hypothetical protein
MALALIEFETLAGYEAYRERIVADPDSAENVRRVEEAGCILVEDRSVLRRHPPAEGAR